MQPRPLTEADLPRAAALSALAGWNQTPADWRIFLHDGDTRVLDDGDPASLAASAAVLRFGRDLAWISMVLVRPDRRRQGLASALMRWAVAELDGVACIALDATPDGRQVYRRLGFADVFGFTRWRVDSAPVAGVGVRPLREGDWPALLSLDEAAFGAPRAPLLRGFARRLPAAAWIAEDGSGFVLGRDGLRAPGLGPLVAADHATARALLAAARHGVGAPVLLDLADDAAGVAAGLGERLRGFTRMTRGAAPPGDARRLVAMGGPEFG